MFFAYARASASKNPVAIAPGSDRRDNAMSVTHSLARGPLHFVRNDTKRAFRAFRAFCAVCPSNGSARCVGLEMGMMLMFESSKQTRRGDGHSGRLELREERAVCSMRMITSISERAEHATAICPWQAASRFWDERLRSGKPDRTAMGQARTNT